MVCCANLSSHIITESSQGYSASEAVGPICMAAPRAYIPVSAPCNPKTTQSLHGSNFADKGQTSSASDTATGILQNLYNHEGNGVGAFWILNN